jgi:hypothetical protein
MQKDSNYFDICFGIAVLLLSFGGMFFLIVRAIAPCGFFY